MHSELRLVILAGFSLGLRLNFVIDAERHRALVHSPVMKVSLDHPWFHSPPGNDCWKP